MGRTNREISAALSETPLFESKTWRISPEAWPLSAAQLAELEKAGGYCLEFMQALERLYLRSATGKKILRNRPLETPWVADYLERGKPANLVRHMRSGRLQHALPFVIRPDLLVLDDGFALTEMDSVPGGIGLTDFLNGLYGGASENIVGGDSMAEDFFSALAALRPDKPDPLVAILVSDESSTYRPEMERLASVLRAKGRRVHCRHPSELMPMGEAFCIDVDGSPAEADIVYRFWELYDAANVPVMEDLMKAVEAGSLVVTPPMRSFAEEKLALALLHHPILREFWQENLSAAALAWLLRSIPKAWVMDPAPLPPGAVLDGPTISGRPMHDWRELENASQKERDLIIKISGFDENAWGARGVLLGSDASREEWRQGIAEALERAGSVLHIVQEYRKPTRLSHPVYRGDSEETVPMQGRVRLCPYYFVKDGAARLSGVLATLCPADKKIIHGMRDAALVPCRAPRS